MNSDEWRRKIGVYVQSRREDAELSKREAARRAGFSETIWRQLESGHRSVAAGVDVPPNPERATQRGVARALQWPDDWLSRLEKGHKPSRWAKPYIQEDVDLTRSDVGDESVALLRAIAASQVATGAALEQIGVQLAELARHLAPPAPSPPTPTAGSKPPARGAKS